MRASWLWIAALGCLPWAAPTEARLAHYEGPDGLLISLVKSVAAESIQPSPIEEQSRNAAGCGCACGAPTGCADRAQLTLTVELANGRRLRLTDVPARVSVYAWPPPADGPPTLVTDAADVQRWLEDQTVFVYDPAEHLVAFAAHEGKGVRGVPLRVADATGSTWAVQGLSGDIPALRPQVLGFLQEVAVAESEGLGEASPGGAETSRPRREPKRRRSDAPVAEGIERKTPEAVLSEARSGRERRRVFVVRPSQDPEAYTIPFGSVPSLDDLDQCVSKPGYRYQGLPGLEGWKTVATVEKTSVTFDGRSPLELGRVREVLLTQLRGGDPLDYAMVTLPYPIGAVLEHLQPGDEIMVQQRNARPVRVFLRCDGH